MGVSQGRDNYARMHAGFRWQVPEHFNIAQVCCTRWAGRPDVMERTAIRAHGVTAGSGLLNPPPGRPKAGWAPSGGSAAALAASVGATSRKERWRCTDPPA
jgi:hypothetical protein